MREKQSVLQIFKNEYLIIKVELRHFGSLNPKNNAAQNRTLTLRSKLYSFDNVDVNFLCQYINRL